MRQAEAVVFIVRILGGTLVDEGVAVCRCDACDIRQAVEIHVVVTIVRVGTGVCLSVVHVLAHTQRDAGAANSKIVALHVAVSTGN